MWYIYTMEYYSAMEEWDIGICSNIDGPQGHHTKWSKSERERQILLWNLASNTNESIYKTETDSHTQKANSWLPKGRGIEREG